MVEQRGHGLLAELARTTFDALVLDLSHFTRLSRAHLRRTRLNLDGLTSGSVEFIRANVELYLTGRERQRASLHDDVTLRRGRREFVSDTLARTGHPQSRDSPVSALRAVDTARCGLR